MPVILALLFVLSGAAGLFYESVWSRYLGLFVGHSAYAQVIVLVIFLGGMAVGSWLVARWTDRLKEPLFGYAVVEAIIGVIGLVFHDLYTGVTAWAYSTVFPATAGSFSLTIAKWGLAALLILPQSILLGATFPLMTAGVLRRVPRNPGRSLSLLYFANSFGAAIGVLIAGFYLIANTGLPGTILAAAILNFVVAAGAMVAMKFGPDPVTSAQAQAPDAADSELTRQFPALPRILLWTAFGTAIASFIYEIAWIRMLSLALSSATHSFELMLSAFILGLSLGALWIRSRADRLSDPMRTLGIVQWMMGFFAIATLPLYMNSFEWVAVLIRTFAKTESGYVAFNFSRYAVSLVVMLPATFCAGMTLPLITRMLIRTAAGEKGIGQVYSSNTIGSIVGVALASLVMLPLIGLKGLIITGAAIDMGIGAWLLMLGGRISPSARKWGLVAVGATIAVVAGTLLAPRLDRGMLASGVFRFGVLPEKGSRTMQYYKDGRTATVTVEAAQDMRFISTNGKSDGGVPRYWITPCDSAPGTHELRSDAATWVMSSLVALAHVPRAETIAVIGQGTGMTTHLLLGSPYLKKLYTVDIEPEMIRGSRQFLPANRRGFEDPRSEFIIEDAKSYFAASGRKYDLIFSEPSNPWVSGVSGLFTEEFYSRVRNYLTPDGVFGQWIHIYDLDDRLLMTVLAALQKQFKHYEVFLSTSTDMLIIATNAERVPTPDWGVFQYPEIAKDLCHQIPITAEVLNASRMGNDITLGPLATVFPAVNSDFYPHLETGAELTRYTSRQALGFLGLNAERLDLGAAFIGRRVNPVSFTAAPVPDIPRVRALAMGAWLRATKTVETPDTIPDEDRARSALARQITWNAEISQFVAPADWRVFVQRMGDVDTDRHGGTQGYVDEDFYGPIYRYLDKLKAPAMVRAVVDFRHGISGWDFAQAVKAGGPLVTAALNRGSWLPPDELRDGIVIARLKTGDMAGAREAFSSLAPLSRRPQGDFRNALLASYMNETR